MAMTQTWRLPWFLALGRLSVYSVRRCLINQANEAMAQQEAHPAVRGGICPFEFSARGLEPLSVIERWA